jgi:hypothetical protein
VNTVALASGFSVHPINYAKEEPKDMYEALIENCVGYAVLDRKTSAYKSVMLGSGSGSETSMPNSLFQMRRAAQKIYSLKKLWNHQIKLNTGRDYEQEFKRIYIVYYGTELD